jgi:hypothetical protein
MAGYLLGNFKEIIMKRIIALTIGIILVSIFALLESSNKYKKGVVYIPYRKMNDDNVWLGI